MERFLNQAREDYEGSPVRIATHSDKYDEQHVIIEMNTGSYTYYLDWIGAEYAPEPDEFLDCPFDNLFWVEVE
jgi:hypothetical protein